MGARAKVELSNKQAEQLAYALYPSVMEYCKTVVEKTKNKEADCNEEKEQGSG